MTKWILLIFIILSTICRGEISYKLPLLKSSPGLSLSTMTAYRGTLYEAHRSFNLLKFSSQLQVSAYDVETHKLLRHAVIDIPRVHGARASEGFFVSPDGGTLVYAEIHEPNLVLLLSTKDLSEVGHTGVLPFTTADSYRLFAGFDRDGLLSFASSRFDKLRFARMSPINFEILWEKTGPSQPNAEAIIWSPTYGLTWLSSLSEEWTQYREQGESTGLKLSAAGPYRIGYGAAIIGDSTFLAYFGNMSDLGTVVSYRNGHYSELRLNCTPHPYSIGNEESYFGTICTTHPDREPERGGGKILTSEFLLLNLEGLAIAWRHPMDFLSIVNSSDPDAGYQWGKPLLLRVGSKLLIIAPSRLPSLTVFQVDVP